MNVKLRAAVWLAGGLAAILLLPFPASAQTGGNYLVFVTNEKSNDLTVLNGADLKVIATIPVGKRPRGVHASPDGKTVYVAVSGTPMSPPPQLDAQGNPVFNRAAADDDDDEAAKSDKSADGIAVVDVAQRKFLRRIPAGSDPEQFSVSRDGTRLFVANEDVGTASILNIASGKVEHITVISKEPEGVGTAPDGQAFYVTCENDGEIYAVNAGTGKTLAHFNVGGRPRSVDFLPDGSLAFIPSESAGQLHVIDAVKHAPLRTVTLPAGMRPMCVKVGPGARKLYVSTGRGGAVCVLDAKTQEVLNTVKVGARPWGIAISPDGKLLFAANGPSNDISVVDLATEKETTKIKAGESPWGVVVVPQ